jgi:hypothetical protein
VSLAEVVLLVLAATWWWRLGRPRPSLAPARAALTEVAHDPATLAFVVAIGALLVYELVLGLSSPPNDADSLNYHLPRVVAWYRHHGVYWIPNAPTARMNEFQPIAEQQILFFAVATHSLLFDALPQFVAELVVLAAIYGTARRLGYAVRPSACAACLFATFAVVAFEATTAINDLVATAFPIATAFFLLGQSRRETVLAGVTAGIGLGVKLTTIFTWPVLIALVLLRGRRATLQATLGAFLGFVAIGSWTFVLNLAETGRLPGDGGGTTDVAAHPSWPGSMVTFLSIVFSALDLGGLWSAPIIAITAVGVVVVAVVGIRAIRRERPGVAFRETIQVGLPFAACGLVILAAAVPAWATRALGSPVRGPGGSVTSLGFFTGLNYSPDVNASFFGPVGAVLLVGAPFLAAVLVWRRRAGPEQLVLTLALPLSLIAIALTARFTFGYGRFLMVPAALTAPVLASLFRDRAITLAYVVVSVVVISFAITRFNEKRLFSSYGPPWRLSQAAALGEVELTSASSALKAYDSLVPSHAPVGAVLSTDDISSFLLGRGLQQKVTYLPIRTAVGAAQRAGLRYVVVNGQPGFRHTALQFRRAGWSVRNLAGFWFLAEAPRAQAHVSASTTSFGTGSREKSGTKTWASGPIETR